MLVECTEIRAGIGYRPDRKSLSACGTDFDDGNRLFLDGAAGCKFKIFIRERDHFFFVFHVAFSCSFVYWPFSGRMDFSDVKILFPYIHTKQIDRLAVYAQN